MKPKIYKVFECGCRSLTHARLKIANNKFQNCCPEHGLDGPVVRKEYTCAECGLLVELPADTKGGTFLYCKKCYPILEAKRKRARAKLQKARDNRDIGTFGDHSMNDEIKFIDGFNDRKRLQRYYETTMMHRVKWDRIDPEVFKSECEKRGVRV